MDGEARRLLGLLSEINRIINLYLIPPISPSLLAKGSLADLKCLDDFHRLMIRK